MIDSLVRLFSRPRVRKNPASWLHVVTFEHYSAPKVQADTPSASDKALRVMPLVRITMRAHYQVAVIGAPDWYASPRDNTEECLWCGGREGFGGTVLKEKPNCFGGRARWVCVDTKACDARIKRRILLGL